MHSNNVATYLPTTFLLKENLQYLFWRTIYQHVSGFILMDFHYGLSQFVHHN